MKLKVKSSFKYNHDQSYYPQNLKNREPIVFGNPEECHGLVNQNPRGDQKQHTRDVKTLGYLVIEVGKDYYTRQKYDQIVRIEYLHLSLLDSP